MNITVAVGLITAGSTLSAGIIASVTTLKVQGKQLGAQNILAANERAEGLSDKHRAIRREAYVQLLTKLDEVDRMIGACWSEDTASRPSDSRIDAAQDSLRSLDTPANIVRMEGPESVTTAAAAAQIAFKGDLVAMLKVARNHIDDISNSRLSSLDPEAYRESYRNRLQARNKLIDAARTALE